MGRWVGPAGSGCQDAEVTEQRASYLVGRADRVLRAELEEVLGEVGITVAEITALSVLAARPGLSNARLARRSLVTPQGMHKVMKSLESNGFVTRSSSGGRKLDAFITDDGRAMLDRVEPLMDAVEADFLADLSAAERASFVDMLARVSGLAHPTPD